MEVSRPPHTVNAVRPTDYGCTVARNASSKWAARLTCGGARSGVLAFSDRRTEPLPWVRFWRIADCDQGLTDKRRPEINSSPALFCCRCEASVSDLLPARFQLEQGEAGMFTLRLGEETEVGQTKHHATEPRRLAAADVDIAMMLQIAALGHELPGESDQVACGELAHASMASSFQSFISAATFNAASLVIAERS